MSGVPPSDRAWWGGPSLRMLRILVSLLLLVAVAVALLVPGGPAEDPPIEDALGASGPAVPQPPVTALPAPATSAPQSTAVEPQSAAAEVSEEDCCGPDASPAKSPAQPVTDEPPTATPTTQTPDQPDEPAPGATTQEEPADPIEAPIPEPAEDPAPTTQTPDQPDEPAPGATTQEEPADPVEAPIPEPAEDPAPIPDLGGGSGEAAGGPESPFSDDLASLAARAPTGGCLVVSRGGERLFARNPDSALIPASLQKLPLAAAALEILGPDYTFQTTAMARTAPAGGVLDGDLYLVGGGDPLLSTPSFAAMLTQHGAVGTPLADLAADLVDAGLSRIEGGVIAVEDRYDAFARVPDWPQRYDSQSVAGAINAIAVNQGYRTQPGIASTWGLLPHPTPALRAAAVFDDLLEARSVVIPQSPSVAARGGDYSGFVELASVTSAPLDEYLRFMLSESDNTFAEMLVKELGLVSAGAGSSRAGTLAVHGALTDEIPLLAVPADGSGLSPQNLLTCAQVVEVLDIGGPDGVVASGLAVAGRSGTMENRYAGTPVEGLVRGKTGSLNGVASLAGFATTTGGGSLTFAVILNSPSGLIDKNTAGAFFGELLRILVAHP